MSDLKKIAVSKYLAYLRRRPLYASPCTEIRCKPRC